MLYKLVTKT